MRFFFIPVALALELFSKEPPSDAAFMSRPLAYINPELLPPAVKKVMEPRQAPHGPVVGEQGQCALELVDHQDYQDYFHMTRGFLFAIV